MNSKDRVSHSTPLVQKQDKKWTKSEYVCYETPLFSILPRFLFSARNYALGWLHTTIFRFFNVEVTKGGLLFMVLIGAIIMTFEILIFGKPEHGPNAGIIASYIIALTFTLASKNSIWSLLTGASWERTLMIHKSMAFLIGTAVAIHGYYQWQYRMYKMSGVYMAIVLSCMLIFANYILRRYIYNLFYVLHLAGIAAFIYFAYQHGARRVYYGVFLWALDVVIRLIVVISNWARLSRATITLNKNTVMIKLKKRFFNYKPGQYAFLWVPSVSFWEVHPFSISSSPDKDYITFHIRNSGNWTKRLHDFAKTNSSITIGVQGAYGTTSIDIDTEKYGRFVFIAGGIGITPMRSIANTLCEQYSRGRPINKIDFIWSIRDYDMLREVLDEDDHLLKADSYKREIENGSFREKLVNFTVHVTQGANSDEGALSPSLGDDYITFNYSRMDANRLLENIKDDCIRNNQKRVAVLACGPQELINAASKATRALSDKNVSLDFHCETFNL